MNQFIDDFYDTLFKPASGMARITSERTVWHGLIVYFAVTLVSSIVSFGTVDMGALSTELARYLPPQAVAAFLQSWPVLNMVMLFVLAPLLFFLWSALLQFSAELLGGRGRGVQVAAGIGYAQLPYILVAPLALVARYIPLDIVSLAGFAAFVWSVFLKTEAIRTVHGFSRRRAFLAYLLPFVLAVCAFILLFLLLSTFLMPLMSQLFPL